MFHLLNYCRVSCFSPSKLPILWYPLVRGVGTHLIWCLKLPGVFGWDRVSKCFQREAEDFVSCFLVKVGDWDLFFPMRQMALTSWCFGGLGKGQVGMAAPFKRRGKTIVWTKFLKEERSQAKIGVCVYNWWGGVYLGFFGRPFKHVVNYPSWSSLATFQGSKTSRGIHNYFFLTTGRQRSESLLVDDCRGWYYPTYPLVMTDIAMV